ncbi:MAG: Wzz/FepE/Etk N-terminal domain-containing protein [Nitrospiraceae bacterium]|nr:Wzz/FepE/Etk N-terminal domain-containing protein [Nitrospiraceae bacterium]
MDKNDSPGKRDALDYLIVLLKHKKMIFCMTFGLALITAVVSLVMQPVYEAETKILPPEQSGSSLAELLNNTMAGMAASGGFLNVQTPDDLYVGLLESRTVLDRIVDRFNLVKLYGVKFRGDARRKLLGSLRVVGDPKSNIITVAVDSRDPVRSAAIANAFVEELQNLQNDMAVPGAAQRRLFFEKQMDEAKASLLKSEDAMKTFQEKSGFLDSGEQGKAVIEGIAQIRAQIAAQEVQMEVMRSYSTPSNPEFQKAQEVLAGLKAQAAKLETGRGGPGAGPIIPTGNLPAVQADYLNKLRDLKFNETLYDLLEKQYEAARLDEANNAEVIQVIDRAAPPQRRARPKRALMVTVATVLGFFLSLIGAFLSEYREQIAAGPEYKRKIETLKRYMRLRGDK